MFVVGGFRIVKTSSPSGFGDFGVSGSISDGMLMDVA